MTGLESIAVPAAQWVITSFVLPLAQKAGEGLIDRVAAGMDDYFITLVKNATLRAENPAAQGESLRRVQQYLQEHQEAAAQLTRNVAARIPLVSSEQINSLTFLV